MAEKLIPSTPAKSEIEDLIAECIPGGSVCDPQAVADNIRRYCNAWPDPASAEARGDERLGALAKRNILDAIREAYDLGYNDARNAKAVPGDSAPGYHGRDVETDHGGALFNTLQRRWLASQLMSPDERAELERLRMLVNTPTLHSFRDGVVLEAAHQRERWGSEHDVGKAPADWFWLVGYLAGKALHAQTSGDTEKALHHTISTAAALANWHASITGEHTAMRPGIDPAAHGVTSQGEAA